MYEVSGAMQSFFFEGRFPQNAVSPLGVRAASWGRTNPANATPSGHRVG